MRIFYNICEHEGHLKHKLKKISIGLFFFTALFVADGSFALAQTGSAQQSCSLAVGGKVPMISFVLPGSESSEPTGTSGGSATIISHAVTCCCNAQTFSSANVPKEGSFKSCESIPGCFGIPVEEPDRSDFLAAPTDASFKIDSNSAYYPLKGVAGVISKWYAALFYLAVVLAIIQIFRGGFEYAIAAGNSSKTEEAKGIIIEAVIGLAVALLAAGILVFLRGPGVFTFSA